MNSATLTLEPGHDRVPPAPAPRSANAKLTPAAAASLQAAGYGGADGTQRSTGLIVVIGVHLLVGWALASGLARQAIEIVKKPIEMVIVPEEVKPPPPPPPPPKIEKIKEIPKVEAPPPPPYVPPPDITPVAPPPAPVIQVRQPEPPPAPVEIAPPPPPAPPKPAVVKQEISLACPGYQSVLQTYLADTFDRVGVPGVVKTLLKVRGNQVVEVTPQSGPKGYYKYVQEAGKRIKCSAQGAEEVQVLLEVAFQQG